MGWVIAMGILVLIAILPVGICLIYNADGLVLSLLFGWIKIRLYPKASKKEKKEKKTQVKTPSKAKGQGEKKSSEKKSGGKWTDFLPLVDVAVQLLGSLRRKIRLSRLEMNLCMASDDPCDLAVNYGKTWAAVGGLMPLMERIFVIKKRNIQVQCDFTATATTVIARADITITVGRIFSLVTVYGVKALREYFKIMKLRKGGA